MSNNKYFTPPKLAKQLVMCAKPFLQSTAPKILDPCAGGGALVKACRGLFEQSEITAYEIDKDLCEKHKWTQADFLTVQPALHDLVVCNPPFNEQRSDEGNGSRGRDLAFRFLLHCSAFARVAAFIMHQNKGCQTFQQKVAQAAPNLRLMVRKCVDKANSKFLFKGKDVFVPSSIYIYVNDPVLLSPFPIVEYLINECSEFVLVELNDPRTNIIVKRWGSPRSVGRVVTTDPRKIKLETDKTRSTYGRTQGVNFHLFAGDVEAAKRQFTKMQPFVDDLFDYARDCSNVSITSFQLITLFLKSLSEEIAEPNKKIKTSE